MTAAQRHAVQWLINHPRDFIPLGDDLENCELACSLVTLGVAELLDGNRICLKSATKARQWLEGWL